MKNHNYPLIILGLFTLITIILILRCFNAVFYPILLCEDGTEMLAYYLNNPNPLEVFRFSRGYISLLPNILGFLATSLFPIYITPYIMVAFSLMIASASFSVFSLRRYRIIVRDDTSRILICLIIALIPLGNHAIMTTLAYSQWNIFILALLLIMAPLPTSNYVKVAQSIFIALAIFSHPISVIFIPICFILFFLRPSLTDRITNISIIVLVLLYSLFAVEPSSFNYKISINIIATTFKYILYRIVFEPVFGNYLRLLLQYANATLVINFLALFTLLILICSAVSYYIKTAKQNIKTDLIMFVFLLFVIFTVTFFAVVRCSVYYPNSLWGPHEQQYFYTQQLLFVFMAVLCIVRLIQWKSLAGRTKILLLILFMTYFSYLNIHNEIFFSTSKEQGMETMKFLKYADYYINSNKDGKSPKQLILYREGKWDIIINLHHDKRINKN